MTFCFVRSTEEFCFFPTEWHESEKPNGWSRYAVESHNHTRQIAANNMYVNFRKCTVVFDNVMFGALTTQLNFATSLFRYFSILVAQALRLPSPFNDAPISVTP